MSDYPIHLQEMPEFQSLEIACENIMVKLQDRIDEMFDNLLISTSRESGISRREKILKIKPLDTDTLEDRRYRVMLKWYDTYPYTEPDLIRRMDRLCGKGEYVLEIDKVQNHLKARLELTSKKKLASMMQLLDEIVSLNVTFDISVRYNQWLKLENLTWADVANMTWGQIREEVLS